MPAAAKFRLDRPPAPAGPARKSRPETLNPSKRKAASSRSPRPRIERQPLGNRIREFRKARNWSLDELSTRSGIASSTLSKIENHLLSLTYDRLCAVAEAFDLTPSQFIADPSEREHRQGPTARFSITRRGGGESMDTPNYAYTYMCTSLQSKRMVPLVSRLRSRTLKEFGPLVHHEGEEFSVVMKGKVDIHTEFYQVERLEEGDGVYLDSRMGHAYLNAGDGEAVIMTVNCSH
jgi:transcriptional regulator with XRE-family HTH domain